MAGSVLASARVVAATVAVTVWRAVPTAAHGLRPLRAVRFAAVLGNKKDLGASGVRRRYRVLIASLSPKARLVVILRYQEDLTPDEIANVTGIPVATVKSQLQRSLAMLRQKVVRLIGDAGT